ncbi:MAG TPA: orotate phosphoribosyltransferase [Fibrobacteria bacterium]|nr:orotate phosphoribosyltransferase [Fibrobacteria bacterium]
MENLKNAFIEFMLSAGALRFGDFTTKSGRKTPYFINTGAYVKASQIQKLGEFYARAIRSAFGQEVDNLFGPAYKGIPLAVTASMALHRLFDQDVTYTFNRKEPKDHGEGGTLVGYDYASRAAGGGPCKVVIIEDVTTAGTSVRENMPLISRPGIRPVGLVVSVDRMERGKGTLPALREIEAEYGLKTAAIVNLEDIMAFLESGAGDRFLSLDPGLPERMRAYKKEYGS